ncbi:MAG: hypothetical protein D3910_05565, partial [Candidatus Electrothrix sp. ATG2]|nr:hypothetical protein [Candidatus Electrothrix sp. ATG2]
MLVICEDCAKKYSIDEKKIKASKVKFKCRACGHIIIVEKPPGNKASPFNDLTPKPFDGQRTADHAAREEESNKKKKKAARPALRHQAAASGKGLPFFVYLSAIMLIGLLLISTLFVHFSLNIFPDILRDQLESHSRALTESLKGTIASPLSQKDYLTV